MSNEKNNIINLDEVQENIPPENAVTDESSKWRNVGKNLWSAVSKFTKNALQVILGLHVWRIMLIFAFDICDV